MNTYKELIILGEWLEKNSDLPFFSDVKLKNLGFTFVGSNVYRYSIILKKLSQYVLTFCGLTKMQKIPK